MEQGRREKVVEVNDSFLATQERGSQPMAEEESQISPKKVRLKKL